MSTVLHLQYSRCDTAESVQLKRSFVKLIQLPDLSVTTAAGFIRHRSIAHVNMAFYAGPEVRDYFPSAFIYSPSHVTNITHGQQVNNE